jgi:RNA polymerase sigma-70 factor (ECF subfamily)
LTVFQDNRPLLEAFRRGDTDAIRRVYRHYVNDVERFVRAKLSTPGGVDFDLQRDVVQDIFIRAFSPNARLAFDGERPYKPYLLSISRNIVIDFVRKRGREGRHLLFSDGPLEAGADMASSMSQERDQAPEDVHWDRCAEASREYVSGLDALTQRFIQLRFREEMPQLDVADVLGITRWKVRSLEKRVQKGLRRYLKQKNLVD